MLKYYEDGLQKKIVLDCRSFLEAKSHFNDPNFTQEFDAIDKI